MLATCCLNGRLLDLYIIIYYVNYINMYICGNKKSVCLSCRPTVCPGMFQMYMAIEALADGGVKMGLPRVMAQRFAAQMVMVSRRSFISLTESSSVTHAL